jgi:hypothetical protein
MNRIGCSAVGNGEGKSKGKSAKAKTTAKGNPAHRDAPAKTASNGGRY